MGFYDRNKELLKKEDTEETNKKNDNFKENRIKTINISQNLVSIIDLLRLALAALPLILVAIFNCFKNIFSKPKSFEGKICLITGTGRGLGRELSIQLAKLGAIIVCVDIREDANNETVKLIKEFGGKAHGYTCNVAKYEEVNKLAENVQKDVGRVYMLINNAALIMSHKAGEWPPEDVISMYNVNVLANYWTIQAFLPGMKEINEGHIVNIVSAASLMTIPGLSVYGATKTANESMLRTLRLELNYDKDNKIIVTAVHPGIINSSEEIRHFYLDGNVGMLKVEDVAEATIDGIKYNKTFITIPGSMKYSLELLRYLPENAILKGCEILNICVRIPSEKFKQTIPFREIKQKCL